MRQISFLAALLILAVFVCAPSATVSQTKSPSSPIKDGIGVGEILIGVSSAAEVEASYGMKYDLINKNDYSYRMDYADLGLAFYYCHKDEKKKVFLVELHHGVSSRGITIGESTLRDVFRIYGNESGGEQTDVHEYPGIQFYLEHDPTAGPRGSAARLDKKVVEIDIVAPDKSSNFCD